MNFKKYFGKSFRYGNHNGVFEDDTILERLGLACILILLLPFMIVLYVIERITNLKD